MSKRKIFFSVLSVDYCGQAMIRDATGYKIAILPANSGN
jgi:hypothetical protein